MSKHRNSTKVKKAGKDLTNKKNKKDKSKAAKVLNDHKEKYHD